MAKEPLVDSAFMIEELISMLSVKSTKIRVQIIQSLEAIGKAKPEYSQRFVQIATQLLSSQYPLQLSADHIKVPNLKIHLKLSIEGLFTIVGEFSSHGREVGLSCESDLDSYYILCV